MLSNEYNNYADLQFQNWSYSQSVNSIHCFDFRIGNNLYGSTHTLSRWHNVRKSIEDETEDAAEEAWFMDSIELISSETGFWHLTATIVELGVGFPRKRKFLEEQWSEPSVDRWWKGRFSGGAKRVAGLVTAIDDQFYEKVEMLVSVFLLLLWEKRRRGASWLFCVGSGFSYPYTSWHQQPNEPSPITPKDLKNLDNSLWKKLGENVEKCKDVNYFFQVLLLNKQIRFRG